MTIQDHIRALYSDYTEVRGEMDKVQRHNLILPELCYSELEDAVIDTRDKLMDAIKIVTGLTSDELEKIR